MFIDPTFRPSRQPVPAVATSNRLEPLPAGWRAGPFTAAGFLTRRETGFGTMVVVSTGVMEDVFGQCMREMRDGICSL